MNSDDYSWYSMCVMFECDIFVQLRPLPTPWWREHSKMIKKGIKTKKPTEVHWDTTRPVIHNAPF